VISRGLTPLGEIVIVGTTGATGAGVGVVGVITPVDDGPPPHVEAVAASAIVTNEERSFRQQ